MTSTGQIMRAKRLHECRGFVSALPAAHARTLQWITSIQFRARQLW